MAVILIPHRGTDVRVHKDVAEAQAAIKAEYDQMYGSNTIWHWRFDRFSGEWVGIPDDQDDDIWSIKELP